MKIRGFEKISEEQFVKDLNQYDDLKYNDISLPKRSTSKSAGYDLVCLYDLILKSNEEVKIPTGLKSYMQDNEYLLLIIRSSVGFKYNVRLCNQVGVIDADYYSNPSNDGHIWLSIKNEGNKDFIMNKGDRIVQAIFCNYLLCDNDIIVNEKRIGGIGSTNKGDGSCE